MTYYPNGIPTSPAAAQAASAAAAERYAAVRLTQAVKAGLISHDTFAALRPGQYAAAWRMVSQNLQAPSEAAGYSDPGYWLRMAGAGYNTAPNAPAQGPAPVAPAPHPAVHQVGPAAEAVPGTGAQPPVAQPPVAQAMHQAPPAFLGGAPDLSFLFRR